MFEKYYKRKIGSYMAFGFLTVAGLFVLGGFGAYFGMKATFESIVSDYTDPVPRELPKVDVSREEGEAILGRWENFSESMEKAEQTEELELSATDVNYLISSSREPLFLALRDKAFVRFEGNQIKSEIALPLDGLEIKEVRGRYLNGDAELSIALEEGEFEIEFRSIAATGRGIPDALLDQVQSSVDIANLLTEAEPCLADLLQYLDEIRVEDGKLRLKPKRGQNLEDLRKKMAR